MTHSITKLWCALPAVKTRQKWLMPEAMRQSPMWIRKIRQFGLLWSRYYFHILVISPLHSKIWEKLFLKKIKKKAQHCICLSFYKSWSVRLILAFLLRGCFLVKIQKPMLKENLVVLQYLILPMAIVKQLLTACYHVTNCVSMILM